MPVSYVISGVTVSEREQVLVWVRSAQNEVVVMVSALDGDLNLAVPRGFLDPASYRDEDHFFAYMEDLIAQLEMGSVDVPVRIVNGEVLPEHNRGLSAGVHHLREQVKMVIDQIETLPSSWVWGQIDEFEAERKRLREQFQDVDAGIETLRRLAIRKAESG